MAFMEYLIQILMSSGRKIVETDVVLLYKYARSIEKEYAIILETIRSEALDGKLIELEKYVKKKVNGTFSRIIEHFLRDYDKQDN